MKFQEATRTRRLVGEVEEDEDVVEAISRLCRDNEVQAGHLRAVGTLSSIELVRFDEESGEYDTVYAGQGAFEVVSLTGNVSRLGEEVALRLEALVSVVGPAGPQFLSGQLRGGRAVSCEFVLEVFEDLAIERRLDADSGRLSIRAIHRTEDKRAPAATESPAESPADEAAEPVAGKGMSWEDAAEEAEEAADKAEAPAQRDGGRQKEQSAEDIYGDLDFDEPLMESGDILDHPKLGRCRVMKVEEGEFVHVRLPRGRIRKLSLEIVDVEFDREENGRRVYKARVGT